MAEEDRSIVLFWLFEYFDGPFYRTAQVIRLYIWIGKVEEEVCHTNSNGKKDHGRCAKCESDLPGHNPHTYWASSIAMPCEWKMILR